MRLGLSIKGKSTRILHAAMECLGALVFLLFLGNADWSVAQAQSPPAASGIVAHLEYREVDFAPVRTLRAVPLAGAGHFGAVLEPCQTSVL